ncbi:MAG TPA: hypothetical protein VKZ53_18240 [Candidatus Angelobacter sp.]|nr:hypothetical protein [Candidatus Angelobacter sp.]
MIESTLPKSLSCLLSHDRQTGLWVNHCLDFDLVTSGISEDQAWNSMKAVLQAHIESCLADNFIDGFSKRANIDAWVAFAQQFTLGNFRSERLRFHLGRNSSPASSDLWLKGVEVEAFPPQLSAAC